MSFAEFPLTLDELAGAINLFIKRECEKGDGHLVHRDCGSAIRIGYLPLFYLNRDGSLDPGLDGFGIGPKEVPYCEGCFPPDGFKYAYAVRFPILRERRSRPNFEFVWGNKGTISKNQRLLLKS